MKISPSHIPIVSSKKSTSSSTLPKDVAISKRRHTCIEYLTTRSDDRQVKTQQSRKGRAVGPSNPVHNVCKPIALLISLANRRRIFQVRITI